MISYTARQRHLNRLIARAPGSCTVYRRRESADAEEAVVSFDGRLIEVGAWGARSLGSLAGQPGEGAVGLSHWCILAPADAPPVGQGDTVKHESPTGKVRWFTVVVAKQRDEGWEIMVDERQ